jgi:hypothetical protein
VVVCGRLVMEGGSSDVRAEGVAVSLFRATGRDSEEAEDIYIYMCVCVCRFVMRYAAAPRRLVGMWLVFVCCVLFVVVGRWLYVQYREFATPVIGENKDGKDSRDEVLLGFFFCSFVSFAREPEKKIKPLYFIFFVGALLRHGNGRDQKGPR